MSNEILVGGSNAGRTVTVEDGQFELTLKKRHSGFQSTVGDLGVEEYVRQEITDTSGAKCSVFVVEGASAAKLLLEHFRSSHPSSL